jgi:DNA polymerase-1
LLLVAVVLRYTFPLTPRKKSSPPKLFEGNASDAAPEPSKPTATSATVKSTVTKAEAPAVKAAIPAVAPKGAHPPIFLLDAMSFIFRAYHAMARQKGMSTRTGLPTAATYVFVNMLRKLRADFQPRYLAAVFDVSAPTFRDQQAAQITSVRKFDSKTQSFQEVAYAGYKANRKEMPGDLVQQVPYIRRALEAYRIPILQSPGYEADDVIGTLAQQAAQQGHPVYVVSSDKDMLQLVNEHVCVLNPPKDNLICDRAKVEEILGVPPERVVDVMALRGDAIDNIPGAPGIGDKGSVELIRRFGSVEATLEHATEIEKKTYRESLLNNRDVVLKSKELATIDTQVPVTLDLAAMMVQEPDAAAARELFTELEFTSLVKDFLPAVEIGATDYREATLAREVEDLLKAAKGATLSLALEPPGAPPPDSAKVPEDEEAAEEGENNKASLLAKAPAATLSSRAELEPARLERVAISMQPGSAVVIPLASAAGETVKAALAETGIPKAVHDYKSVLHTLAEDEHQLGLEAVRDDPMLFSYLLDPTYSSHTLPEIALRRFNLKLSGSLAEAADITGRLASTLRGEIEQAGLLRIYEEIDLPLVPVLARMEQAGVKLDCDVLAKMSHRLEGECERKAQEIYQSAGLEFNINSPKQLGQILFEKLNLPKPVKYGKGRTVSTAVDVLESLAAQHEVPRLVLEYRQLAKLKSTYVDALPALLNISTQRLHTTFDQTNTATGRLSSRSPNLQNIPIRTELGREIRAAFIAEAGHVLLSADYSQVELRLLAHFSGDELLLAAFRRGDDIHTLTAAQVFGVPPLMVTPEHRRRAKAINFGIPYGLSPFGLAQQLGIDRGDARQFIDAYFERYRGVRSWLDATLEQARRDQRVSTLFGRIRPIPDINSKNANLRNFAERTAVNTPLQGTAADLIKLAMIRLDEEIRRQRLKSRMTLQVHDELVFEVPEEELGLMRTLVRKEMENVHKLRVPLLVELGVGKNWRDLE